MRFAGEQMGVEKSLEEAQKEGKGKGKEMFYL